MEVLFEGDLERILTDGGYSGGFGPAIVKAYRKRVGLILQAKDERDIRNIKGNRLEKMEGNIFTIRLNDQWRLYLSFEEIDGVKTVVLHKIDDPH